MLLKLDYKKQIFVLILSLLIIFILEHYFKFRPGVRISWYNLLAGIFSALIGFLIFNLSNFLLLLVKGKNILDEFKIDNRNYDQFEIIGKSFFIGAIEELFLRSIVFALLAAYPLIAYFSGAGFAYLAHLSKKQRFYAISHIILGLFSCFLYDLHRSYFLNFISCSLFWIFWLSYLNSSYFNRNYSDILNIRKKLILKYKK